MELTGFDPRNFIILILLFLGSCDLYQAGQPVHMDLNLPREEAGEKTQATKNSISVVLLSEDRWFCYPDTAIGRGKLYSRKDFETLLVEKKKELGDSLVILLKPTSNSSYKTTVDALDYMTIHKISRFAMVKLNEQEEQALYSGHFLEPPEPVKIESPVSATKSLEYDYPVFLVELRKNQSVWYNVITDDKDKNAEKVSEPIQENLRKLIAGYKKQCSGQNKKTTYLVKGHPDSKYDLFEKVIAALRDNEEFKYNLITTDN
jgi:biopolymer transport protein ExbD